MTYNVVSGTLSFKLGELGVQNPKTPSYGRGFHIPGLRPQRKLSRCNELTFSYGDFVQTHLRVVIGDLTVRRQFLGRRILELEQQKFGVSTFRRLLHLMIAPID